MDNPEYRPAIELALNLNVDGPEKLTLVNFYYIYSKDLWAVECQDIGKFPHYYDLNGSFVRSCFKAVQKGVTSWVWTRT